MTSTSHAAARAGSFQPTAAQSTPAPERADRVDVGAARRTAVAVAGLFACLLPLSFGTSAVVMLLTGIEADHRFHQVAGQGVLSCGLWLAGLLPLVRAGLSGRRPSTRTGVHLLAFVAATVVAGALAPEAGALFVVAHAVLGAGLLWLAVPLRPRLRGVFRNGLDPVLAPVAVLMAALVTPFALSEADLQHAMADEHAEMAHYFDMAWVVLVLLALTTVAALSSQLRRLALLGCAGLVVVGAARATFTPETTWSAAAVVLGTVGTVAALLRSRAGSRGTAA